MLILFPEALSLWVLSSRSWWWSHQKETFSVLLALCAGNSPVTCEFPAHRPVTQSFDIFFNLRLNKRLSKQSWGWWFETPSSSLWRHSNIHYPVILKMVLLIDLVRLLVLIYNYLLWSILWYFANIVGQNTGVSRNWVIPILIHIC